VVQKDSLMNDCEKRLVRNLKEKEQECIILHKRVENLEHERREANAKIDFMDKLNEDKNAELLRIRQANDFKKSQIDDLQHELRKVREDAERTTSLKLNDQERKEIEL
jgi:hypothetical protein